MLFIARSYRQAGILTLLAILTWAFPQDSLADTVSEGVTSSPPQGSHISTRVENGKIVFVTNKAISNNERQRIGIFNFTLPNCASGGFPRVVVKDPPHNGTITVEQAMEPAHPSQDPCTAKDTVGTGAYYTANPGYIGPESFRLDIRFPDGGDRLMQYDLTVTDKK